MTRLVQQALGAIEEGPAEAQPSPGLKQSPAQVAPCAPGRRDNALKLHPFWREALEGYARRAYLNHRPYSPRLARQFSRRVQVLLALPQYSRRGWEPEAAAEG
jgi:hypothetical protein